jgi:hypothetical protein
MVVDLKEYESAAEIAANLDSEITRVKSTLGEYLRRLDDIRALAERSKKIREMVLKLAGKRGVEEKLGEINVGDMNIVLDAGPFHELTAIEKVVRSQQDRLTLLQKARESLDWLDEIEETDGITYLVLERDGAPEKVLLKIS